MRIKAFQRRIAAAWVRRLRVGENGWGWKGGGTDE